jgi:hypothetical protein
MVVFVSVLYRSIGNHFRAPSAGLHTSIGVPDNVVFDIIICSRLAEN